MKKSRARCLAYRFFSLLFSYPSNRNVKLLKRSLEALLKELSDLPGLKELSEAVLALPEGGRQLEELQAAYTSTFINNYPDLPVPPYESFYRGGVLLGDPALNAARAYGSLGLRVDSEMPDHLAVELEYLYYVCEKSMEEEEARFLGEHLSCWVGRFVERLNRSGAPELYKLGGTLLLRFVSSVAEGCREA